MINKGLVSWKRHTPVESTNKIDNYLNSIINNISKFLFQEFPFIKAIVAGLDLTKHEKLEECIQEFKEWNPKSPKFVGVRHLVGNQPFDFLTR